MQVSLAEAQRLVLDAAATLPAEEVPLELARGRILAHPLVAPDDLVPFARSAMDGFALRASDTVSAPLRLAVAGAVFAQGSTQTSLPAATAVAVATGAPLPHGADAVIPSEAAVIDGSHMFIMRPLGAGDHVFAAAEDARAGDLLAAAGTNVSPALMGVLASAGHSELQVVRRPRAAVICTGDELVDVGATPGFGQIRNSNLYSVAATLEAFGADVVLRATIRDDRGRLLDAAARALHEADIVVSTGGASVGERDYTKGVFAELGVRFSFTSVAMRPARPTAFGARDGCIVAMLPGNPAAAFVAMHELVRPAVRKLAGDVSCLPARVYARLDGELHVKAGRTYFAFVRLCLRDGSLEAIPLENQCSSLTRIAAQAHGLAVIEPGGADLSSGTLIAVDLFEQPATPAGEVAERGEQATPSR